MSRSWIKNLLGRAKGWLDPQQKMLAAQPTGEWAVGQDHMDHRIFRELLDTVPAVEEMVDEISQEFDYSENLVGDTFAQFFKGDPELAPRESMRPEFLHNWVVADQVAKDPETERLRAMTQHDRYGAAMATVSVTEKVTQWLREHEQERKDLEQAAQQQQQAQQLTQQAQQAAQQLEQLMPGGDQPGDGAGENPDGEPTEEQAAAQQALADALAAAQAAQDAADQAMAEAMQAMEDAAPSAKAAVHEGVKEATDQLDEEEEAFRAWGVDEGQMRRMSYDERKQWAERLLAGSNLRDFHRLMGRWRMLELAERSKRVQYGRDEIVGVEMSGDMSRVLPVEFARATAHRMLKLDMLQRLSDEQLLSEQWVGVEKEGAGAIIALIDTSSSMGDADVAGATRIAWAKGLALALQQRAKATHRDFVAILFGSARQQKMFTFPKGTGPLEDVIEMVEFDWCGGTDFMRPISLAMKVLEAEYNSSGRMRGDLLLITDGECGVTPDWMSEYRETQHRLAFRTFGVQVGHDADYDEGSVLHALCDGKVTDIVELADCEPKVMAATLRNL